MSENTQDYLLEQEQSMPNPEDIISFGMFTIWKEGRVSLVAANADSKPTQIVLRNGDSVSFEFQGKFVGMLVWATDAEELIGKMQNPEQQGAYSENNNQTNDQIIPVDADIGGDTTIPS